MKGEQNMKRMKKAIVGLAVGAIAALGVVGFAACGGDKTVSGTAEGQYDYANPWDATKPHYGVKVKVTVEDDIIQSLEIVKSNYVQATEGWEGREDYLAHESEILAKFKNLDVDDIMKLEIAVDKNGQPITAKNKDGTANPDFDASTFVVGETNLLHTGATQSCARIILALQNAIEKL